MSTAQKVAISLLFSVILFAAFTVVAFAGLFDVIETRFYQPSIVKAVSGQLDTVAHALNEYNTAQLTRFSGFATDESVRQSVLSTQDSVDITKRTQLVGMLMEETPGLLGIRIIDSLGKRIHFSTFQNDFLRRETNLVSYRNYGTETDTPFEKIVTADGGAAQILFDTAQDTVMYSYPFYDSYSAYRGSIVFYVSASEFMRYLVGKNIIRVNDSLLLAANDRVHGVILGVPAVGRDLLVDTILSCWQNTLLGAERIVDAQESAWVLFSTESPTLGFVGQVYDEAILAFPQNVKILLLISLFITVYLILFLMFNLKQDDLVVIRSHIRRFQLAVIAEYLEKGEEIQWEHISKDIIYRKHDLSAEIKKALGKRAKRHPEELQTLLDKSWEEIVTAIGAKSSPSSLPYTNTAEIKDMLEQVLKSGIAVSSSQSAGNVGTVGARTPSVVATGAKRIEHESSIDEVEELEELGEIDEVEELGELDEVSEAEELEELGEIDEAEELGELDEVSEAEELEELGEIDEVEELNEVSEAEEAEEVEELDEVVETSEIINSLASDENDDVESLSVKDTILDVEIAHEDLQLGVEREPEAVHEEDVASWGNLLISRPSFADLDTMTSLFKHIHDKQTDNNPSNYPVATTESFKKSSGFLNRANAVSQSLEKKASTVVIEEKDGIFRIAETNEPTHIEKNKIFKDLVDSVLK